MEFIVKKFDDLTIYELYEILKSRFQIFACEQKITCENEIDGVDYNSYHAFIRDNNEVVGYLRFFYDENGNIVIGRVLSLYHNEGLGTFLINNTLEYLKNNFKYQNIILHSQIQVVDFYKKFGFKVISDEYMEADIIHVTMGL